MSYQRILLAIDFGAQNSRLIERARALAGQAGVRLSVVHVVEPVLSDIGYDVMPMIPVELERELVTSAESQLQKFVDDNNLEASAAVVRLGSVKGEILNYAEELGADLIVIGSHGRRGIGLLLGSSANAVLHGAQCDVLAVRLEK